MSITDDFDGYFKQVLLQTIPCAVIVLDAEHRIIYWNPGAEQLTGYTSEQMVGSTCEILQAKLSSEQDNAAISAMCPAAASGQTVNEEYQIRTEDGRIIPVLRRGQSIVNRTGHTIGYVQALVDLSSIKQAQQQIRNLTHDLARIGRFGELVGNCQSMRKLYEAIELVAPTDATVVIQGETGTGKELVARAIHKHSSRANRPMLAVNCGALPETLLDAELFGHIKGAFTGAVNDRAGRFEQVSGGTLLLDEIGELSPASQVKLLRALQEGEITRVGENQPRQVDVRIIAATHRDLAEMVKQRTFREDLYYRLQVMKLYIPPLRERLDDLYDLVTYLIGRLNEKYHRKIHGCTPQAMALLQSCSWPGNVRQLEHALEHAFVVTAADRSLIDIDALPAELAGGSLDEKKKIPMADNLHVDEISLVNAALFESNGNKAKAARILGITRAGLYKKLKRLGIS